SRAAVLRDPGRAPRPGEGGAPELEPAFGLTGTPDEGRARGDDRSVARRRAVRATRFRGAGTAVARAGGIPQARDRKDPGPRREFLAARPDAARLPRVGPLG